MLSLKNDLKVVEETLSVPILLKTWFSPWKQIQTQSSFRNFFQAAIDNLVSRLVGAAMRTFLLIAAFALTFGIIAGGLAMLILWPLIPLLVLILPVMTLVI